ncbi:unnamed protein product, partial [Tetraodon nigroviridis]
MSDQQHQGSSGSERDIQSAASSSSSVSLPPVRKTPKQRHLSIHSLFDCLRQYLRIEISESRVNICCPECSERFNPHDIQLILGDKALMEKYEEFMLRRWLITEPDCRWCPAPDCGYAVVAFGCATARRSPAGATAAGRSSATTASSCGTPTRRDDIKPCPRCAAYIIKMNDGSCNHMTCAVCGCEFCWLCMKEISDLHYLSPSGCTFWGKKPWSRKKKILWQLGTLVGAPVGIALIAGIAAPAMIIGIPVYVGRKIFNRYEGQDSSRHRRNLVIAGVCRSRHRRAIMLAYVYGVVPISLCRSGGCGVSAGSGKGVRIEFDDENDNTASGAAATGINMSDGASTTALAGTSITGSLSGSCCNRMDVQADVQKERCSLSGESATVSLGTASDNASTKAMAGSILSAYTPLERDSSLEVQADVEAKPENRRHGSIGSSQDGDLCSPALRSKESAAAGDKSRRGKLWRSSSSSKGGSKYSQEPGGSQTRLLEQHSSTDSSRLDSPSLSGSLPSVADSHCSRLSSELSGSDPETSRAARRRCSSSADARLPTAAFGDAAVTPLTEVERDRPEQRP